MVQLYYGTGTDEPLWIDKAWLNTVVVVGLTCFILCLKYLSKVQTSKMGMIYGIVGMSALIIGYWVDETYTYDDGRWLIAISMAPGIIIGMVSALSVEITGLPQLVGTYNGFGGLAAALEGIGLYLDPHAKDFVRGGEVVDEQTSSMLWVQAIALILSIIIGMITFTGSMVAVLKLHGIISSKPRVIPHRPLVSFFFFVALTVFGTLAFTGGQDWNDRGLGIAFIVIVAVLSSIYGIVAVMAIGGGDMPVSISFLNSLSGLSTSMAGFMLSNKALIVSGAFVSASGIILTLVMCHNMNRSMSKVLVGGFGGGGSNNGAKKKTDSVGTVKQVLAEDVVEVLTQSKKIIIVPGYGMAVAKAQYAIAELATRLRERGLSVRFAVHPVAGRLPGHMNVLLAEAKVPYDITFSMDDINSDFSECDLAIVLGANDIVNPSSQTDPNSPIAGMPVLEVWKAKQTICMKRTLNVGYAGVDNALFYMHNNSMFLGDARKSLEQVLNLLSASTPTPDNNKVESSDVESQQKKIEEENKIFSDEIPDLHSIAYLRVGICKETDESEKRVAMVPQVAKSLLKSGIQIVIESGAGDNAGFSDGSYATVGGQIKDTAKEVYDTSDVIIKIQAPTSNEIDMLGAGKTLISPISPQTEAGIQLLHKASEAGVNVLAVDIVPRVSRAQNIDVLSSQAKLAGYRAVVEASNVYQRFFRGEVTSAGTFPAANVLVIGCGVAGLAAISTAVSMGAIVRAFDTRLDCKEEVESLGGKFLVLEFDDEEEGDTGGTGYSKVMSDEFYRAEMNLFKEQAKEVNIIITTAALPGRRAPILLKKEAVDNLAQGSIIIDLAAATGGNCELTRPGETYSYDNRVTIIGATDLPSRMAYQSSCMYANNMQALLELLCPKDERKMIINMEDLVIRGMACVIDNTITWPPPPSVNQTHAAKTTTQKKDDFLIVQERKSSTVFSKRIFDLTTVGEVCAIIFLVAFFIILGFFAPVSFVNQLLYFILAGFLGSYLIWDVEPALFSPLMSTSNSLSGVVILGGILMASHDSGSATNVLGCTAISISAINVFGGFTVSYRMLLMFKKENKTNT